jgi:ParB/RepB/Spo0J family partition protein
MAAQETKWIEVEKIHPNPDNPRHEAGDVTELAKSITEEDLLQPLLVIPAAQQYGSGHVMIEDGWRRYTAGKERKKVLPCTIRYPTPDENLKMRAVLTGLVTDGHKAALKPMEKAEAYGRLRDEFGLNQTEIAKRTGFSTATIGYYLSLLELSDKSKNDVRIGKISADRAVSAVREHRKTNKEKDGKKLDLGWDPDPFSTSHPLAKRAGVMCVARGHKGHRRFGGACHACWEVVIRQDQSNIDYVDYGNSGLAVPFVPPLLVPISPDGGIRTDMTTNGLKRGV